ncbi:MAG: hypothetical protein ABI465_09570 [Ktedonobacteraceae bacterium]
MPSNSNRHVYGLLAHPVALRIPFAYELVAAMQLLLPFVGRRRQLQG